MTTHSQQQQTVKKTGRGCLTAVFAVAGTVLLLLGLLGVGIWRFAHSPDGEKILGPAKVVLEAQSAPGTKELRALGCQAAMVYDRQKSADAFAAANERDAGSPRLLTGARLLVACQGAALRPPPTCDRIATTYARAVGGQAAGPFDVVTTTGTTKTTCETHYDAHGEPLDRTLEPVR